MKQVTVKRGSSSKEGRSITCSTNKHLCLHTCTHTHASHILHNIPHTHTHTHTHAYTQSKSKSKGNFNLPQKQVGSTEMCNYFVETFDIYFSFVFTFVQTISNIYRYTSSLYIVLLCTCKCNYCGNYLVLRNMRKIAVNN
jgi:hypothetical protein